jgi:L-asparaginase
VTVCFDSKLYRGNRTAEGGDRDYDAFESPNFPLLGTLGVTASFAKGLPPRPLRLVVRLDPRVFLLKVFPGLTRHCRWRCSADRGDGRRGVRAGNVPGGRDRWQVAAAGVREARRRGRGGGGGEPGAAERGDLSLYEGRVGGPVGGCHRRRAT